MGEENKFGKMGSFRDKIFRGIFLLLAGFIVLSVA